jgi:predicted outer membrane repeat protein
MDWIASAGTNEDDCEWSLLSVDSFFAPTPMPTTPSPTPEQGLYISLYAEGSGANKWLQITNGGTVEVDIDLCEVWVVQNGGSWNEQYASSFSSESGVLAPGESYLIANVDSDLAIIEAADYTSSGYTWNGNDAVGLAYDNVLVDSIGEDGDDPGEGWDMCGIPEATVDHTLVRKPGIVSGNTGWAVSAGTNAEDCEWIVLDSDVAFAPTLAPSDAPTTTFAPTRTFSPTPVPSLSLAPTALQVTVDSYLELWRNVKTNGVVVDVVDDIVFPPEEGQLEIGEGNIRDVTVRSSTSAVLSGNGTSTMFHVHTDSHLKLVGLTLADGYSSGTTHGVLYVNEGKLTMQSCKVLRNTGDRSPIVLIGSIAQFVGCEFAENRAAKSGGIMTPDGSTVTVTNSTFEHNHAVLHGGGIYAQSASTITLSASRFEHNRAQEGGAVSASQSSLVVSRSYFGWNHADGDGGALNSQSAVSVTDSTFFSNVALVQGGDVHLEASADFYGCTFANSSAPLACASNCNSHLNTCDYMVVNEGETCANLEADGCDCGGCQYCSSVTEKSATAASLYTTSELKIQESIFANFSVGDYILRQQADTDTTPIEVDTSSFQDNAVPAFCSNEQMIIRNTAGLNQADVIDVAIVLGCDDSELLDYCAATEYCTDGSPIIGIHCYCTADGDLVDPSRGPCLASADAFVPVTHFTVLARKPTSGVAVLTFNNQGDKDLEWTLREAGNPEGANWTCSPTAGVLSSSDMAVVYLSLGPTNLASRDAIYSTNFTFVSSSYSATNRAITIALDAVVSVPLSPSLSNVMLINTGNLEASGDLEFSIRPKGQHGLPIFDASDIAFLATLRNAFTTDVTCRVTFDIEMKAHSGLCTLPLLVAGDFSLFVTDVAGAPVGATSHNLTVSRCPPS